LAAIALDMLTTVFFSQMPYRVAAAAALIPRKSAAAAGESTAVSTACNTKEAMAWNVARSSAVALS
jgi:hypothetical protein